MNRQRFFGTAGALLAGIVLPWKPAGAVAARVSDTHCKRPPYLAPGDVIGITSPAGYITLQEMQPAIRLMESWGFRIRIGSAIGKRNHTFGGTDEERTADLQQLLDDEGVRAIMCARGGYGAVRIVDRLDWSRFRKAPKWVIGFSDITVLHSHIHHHCKVATLHAKMTNSFPDDWSRADPVQAQTIVSIREALTGKAMQYTAIPHLQNKAGTGSGMLVGGNLKTMESLAGTPSDIDTDGKILFVEDTGEYLYSIDRMFWNLKRTGKLSNLKGLVVGGFKEKADDVGAEFGKTVQEIVLEKTAAFDYPVCFNFPVGHQRANFALKCGVRHQLKVQQTEVTLTELT